MAIYIKAEKSEENDAYLIYAYGIKHDNLTGKFKYHKVRFDVDILKYDDEKYQCNNTAFAIAVKIKKFYDENGYYPDSISRQS